MFMEIIWLTLAFIIGMAAGLNIMSSTDIHQDSICPLNTHHDLVKWAQNYYPDIVPSWFKKQNKTYLISIWFLRPELEWPRKIYNKKED